MDHDNYPDSYLRDVLTSVRTIAVVGATTAWLTLKLWGDHH